MSNIFNLIFKKNIISSMCISATLLALIFIFHLIFETFKIGFSHLQIVLIIYAIGIYFIRNFWINLFFWLVVPVGLFWYGTSYALFPLQTFLEYFAAYYIFGLLNVLKIIILCFRKKEIFDKTDYFNFCFSFTVLIFLKYLVHVYASLTWFSDSLQSTLAAFSFNFFYWLLTNLILIPVAFITTMPIMKLFNKFYLVQKNKW